MMMHSTRDFHCMQWACSGHAVPAVNVSAWKDPSWRDSTQQLDPRAIRSCLTDTKNLWWACHQRARICGFACWAEFAVDQLAR